MIYFAVLIKKVGEKIFDELRLLEYYNDLNDHDKSVKSIYQKLEIDEKSDPSIKSSFLEKWNSEWATNYTNLFVVDDYNNITKTKFIDLFWKYYNEKKEDFNRLNNYEVMLKEAEGDLCIRQGVVKAWSPTFDQLLSLYNTQDIKTVIDTFTQNESDQEKGRRSIREEGRMSVTELGNWLNTKAKPPSWKKIFKPKLYQKEKEINKTKFEFLLEATKPDKSQDKINKSEFIDRIMKELREGENNVSSYIGS